MVFRDVFFVYFGGRLVVKRIFAVYIVLLDFLDFAIELIKKILGLLDLFLLASSKLLLFGLLFLFTGV